MIMITIHCL